MRVAVLLAAMLGGMAPPGPGDPPLATPEDAVAKLNRDKVCLKDLRVRVSDRETAWCVYYEPVVEPGQYVIGPEGIICLDKASGRIIDEMIFHASPQPCPPQDEG